MHGVRSLSRTGERGLSYRERANEGKHSTRLNVLPGAAMSTISLGPSARSAVIVLGAAFGAACRTSNTATGNPSTEIGDRVAAALPNQTVTFPTEWRFTPGDQGTFAPTSMVASNSSLASAAGDEIIRAGGNAVDAAVATGFALAVTFPFAGNLGGGGYMVIRMADGRTAAVDYREIAPLAASRDMYIGPDGKLTNESVIGYKASGVPGAVAGMTAALAKFGTKPLRDVLQPAIRLADEGFVVDSVLFASLRGSREYIGRFDGKAVFYPNDEPLQPGTRFRQPALARTLRLIADQGPDAFYKGEVGDSLVAGMQRGGGIITKEDLARYRPEWRQPIASTYRGYRLFTMPPSSSGGVTITETLNILETYDKLPPFGTAAYAHVLASAYQRAFIDRNSKLGDPAFVQVPLDKLTSKSYARGLRKTIVSDKATPTPQLERTITDGMHTTHYSVVDAGGNAVATTTTINNGYGSGVYLTGPGFFMNDEMDDFAAQPGKPNMFGLVQGEQNAIQPGKRMLSAMSPTIVVDPAGKLLLVVGAAGGPRIITATSQVVLNVIEHHMSLPDAMRAPRLHHQALPDTLRFETAGLTTAVVDSLRAMGWGVASVGSVANVNAVMRVNGGWVGVTEPRDRGPSRAVGH
jgi:gamma-glutamyltranspeptidase/glutathione hydrolase